MRKIKEEPLAHDKHTVCGKAAYYKLSKLIGRKGEYLISVYYGKDTAAHRICGRIEDVVKIYRSIVRNAVMPCTLSDVIEDITYPAK